MVDVVTMCVVGLQVTQRNPAFEDLCAVKVARLRGPVCR